MGLGRVNDNSIHIGLGGDFPSKEVKYFINIISFILLNFPWCGIYYSQLPDGQLTAEKRTRLPEARDDWVCVCSARRALTDGVTHSLAHSVVHSTGNVENPCCGRHHAQDTGRRQGRTKPIGPCGGQAAQEANSADRKRRWALQWRAGNCCDKQGSIGMMCLVIEI